MTQLFHSIIYQPIYNALIFLYNVVPGHDLGVAIILLTVIIRVILYPLAKKQIESQKRMQELQPEIKKLQEKYKGDKEKQGKELMNFYKEKKVNPASGCLPLVVQIIFIIALYRALVAGINFSECKDLYTFVACPARIGTSFLGILDLAKPSIILAAITAAAQFVQTKMMMGTMPSAPSGGKADFSQTMNKQMLYLGPLLTLFIGARFPAGLPLYWLVMTLFMIGQQYRVMGRVAKKGEISS
ncbi:MAG: YidC/Oxa1 family membrane protein insertase [Candidatus Moranbacteria bacterium]|jgi:YidC/Oxa1 family membrane protein insertase|nr:YidC/Oxa1 family membrane protein insertase [Candidatus Moranbacteria bacterium]